MDTGHGQGLVEELRALEELFRELINLEITQLLANMTNYVIYESAHDSI